MTRINTLVATANGHNPATRPSSRRKLVLATGHELNDLLQAFPEVAIFDRVVAENGALVQRPATRDTKVLTSPI